MIEPIYDIFLSYSHRDDGLARFVAGSFEHAGLHVFRVTNSSVGGNIQETTRRALVECSTVVILLTPATHGSQYLALEVGMAIGWSKPIFVVYDGIEPSEIPDFLRSFKVIPAGELGDVVAKISRSRAPFDENAMDVLAALYEEFSIPVDRLLLQPVALDEIVGKFNIRTGLAVPAERVAQELLRLRKQKKLPKVRLQGESAARSRVR